MGAIKKLGRNTHGRDFVIGDIHGAFDLVLAAMDRAKFNHKTDRLFSVGDMIDRGPGSDRCAAFLAKPYVHAVRGNHEQMLLDLYADGAPDPLILKVVARHNGFSWWLDVSEDRRTEILEAIALLPLAIEIDTERGSVGLIHAEVPIGMAWGEFVERLDANDPDTVQACLWGRERVRNEDENGVEGVGRVYAGHTPVWGGPVRLGNFYCLDSGAVFGLLGDKEGCLTMVEAMAGTQVLLAPRKMSGLVDLRIAGECFGQPFSPARALHGSA